MQFEQFLSWLGQKMLRKRVIQLQGFKEYRVTPFPCMLRTYLPLQGWKISSLH